MRKMQISPRVPAGLRQAVLAERAFLAHARLDSLDQARSGRCLDCGSWAYVAPAPNMPGCSIQLCDCNRILWLDL